MNTAKEVQSKKEQRAFVQFPLKLYRGNEYFVPTLYSGEFSIFDPTAPFSKVCNNICFLAYDGDKVVGRI